VIALGMQNASSRSTIIKSAINWLVFTATVFYGLWIFFRLLGAVFILGGNDTPLGVVGLLAFGLVPVPASLLALRHRRLAALCFAIAASLWVIGSIDGDLYLAKKFGNHPVVADLVRGLPMTTGVPVALTLFYAITDRLGWPLLRPHSNQAG
jgi:hypothetical protein